MLHRKIMQYNALYSDRVRCKRKLTITFYQSKRIEIVIFLFNLINNTCTMRYTHVKRINYKFIITMVIITINMPDIFFNLLEDISTKLIFQIAVFFHTSII